MWGGETGVGDTITWVVETVSVTVGVEEGSSLLSLCCGDSEVV